MLKKKWILLLGLVLLTGSACVTPTHASSAASVVLTHIQATGALGPKDEMVALYNNSPNEVDITGWCLMNKSHAPFACFVPTNSAQAHYLPSYSAAVVVTELFLESRERTPETVTQIFVAAAQSGGSIVNGTDTVSLIDADGEVVDEFSWSTAMPSGKIAVRSKSATDPRVYETIDLDLAWRYASFPTVDVPYSQVELRTVPPDESNGDTAEPPNQEDVDGPDVVLHPLLTELLPNPDGSDTGKEFIELYNPTNSDILLNDYRLRIGPNLEKVYAFPADAAVPAFGYVAYTNDRVKFTLLNSSSKVQLEYKTELIGESVAYENPPEGQSWSRIDAVWRYTDVPTPNAENRNSIDPKIDTAEEPSNKSSSNLKPCAENQYRNPETNRCRLLNAETSSTAQPCKEGQERNPETNRCRSVKASTEPAPCKEGQERNPETNRCRTITKMTDASHGVKGATTEQTPTNWYFWLGIIGIVSLIVAYGIWEWRVELKNLALALWRKFARSRS